MGCSAWPITGAYNVTRTSSLLFPQGASRKEHQGTQRDGWENANPGHSQVLLTLHSDEECNLSTFAMVCVQHMETRTIFEPFDTL